MIRKINVPDFFSCFIFTWEPFCEMGYHPSFISNLYSSEHFMSPVQSVHHCAKVNNYLPFYKLYHCFFLYDKRILRCSRGIRFQGKIHGAGCIKRHNGANHLRLGFGGQRAQRHNGNFFLWTSVPFLSCFFAPLPIAIGTP
jgi:hypothetical protein